MTKMTQSACFAIVLEVWILRQLPDFVDKAKEEFSVSLSHGKEIHLHQLKKLRRKLKARQKAQGIQFVHGIGKRKTNLQKTME